MGERSLSSNWIRGRWTTKEIFENTWINKEGKRVEEELRREIWKGKQKEMEWKKWRGSNIICQKSFSTPNPPHPQREIVADWTVHFAPTLSNNNNNINSDNNKPTSGNSVNWTLFFPDAIWSEFVPDFNTDWTYIEWSRNVFHAYRCVFPSFTQPRQGLGYTVSINLWYKGVAMSCVHIYI